MRKYTNDQLELDDSGVYFYGQKRVNIQTNAATTKQLGDPFPDIVAIC